MPPATAQKAARNAHFGLAEADIAANQAIHRFAGAHVVDHGLDGQRLIDRFLKAETIGEGVVINILEVEGVAFAGSAGGVEREQFGGGIVRLLGGLALGLFPLAGAERVQRGAIRVGTGIARDNVQLRHRHEELGLVGVMQFEEFLFAEAEIHPDQPAVTADAVAFVHDRVADLEFGEVFQPVVEGGFLLGFAPGTAGCAGEEFGFGDESELVQRKAGLQRADAEGEFGLAAEETGQFGAGFGLHAVLGEHRGQGFAPTGGFSQQHDAAGVAGEVGFQGMQRVFGAAVDGNARQRAGHRGFIFARKRQSTVGFGGGEECFVGKEEFVRL